MQDFSARDFRFASRERPRGRDAFKDVPHRIGASGSPVIEDVAAFLDCRLHASHEAGDHLIFIGEVLELEVRQDVGPPLVFHGGGYRQIQPPVPVPVG